MVTSRQQFSEWIQNGAELPSIEFKSAADCDKRSDFFAKVVRTVLAMANHRGGGRIILGISDDKLVPKLEPLSEAQIDAWMHEGVITSLNSFANPHVVVRSERFSFGAAGEFVILQVEEFDGLPVICRKSFVAQDRLRQVILRKGALYVRSEGTVASVEVESPTQMRSILDLATEKSLRAFLKTAHDAGLTIAPGPSDVARYEDEVGDFLTRPIITRIWERGYWRVVIRPSHFLQCRVEDIAALHPLIVSRRIERAGWIFPAAHDRERAQIGTNFIGQDSQLRYHIETYRIWQSGQFRSLRAINVDWHEEDPTWGQWIPQDGREPGSLLPICDTLATVESILSFAALLSLSEAGDETMHVSITLYGLDGRRLWMDHPRRPMRSPGTATLREYTMTDELDRQTLTAGVSSTSVRWCCELFKRFGWNPSDDYLLTLLSEWGR